MVRQPREGKFGEDEGAEGRRDLEKQGRGAGVFTVLPELLIS